MTYRHCTNISMPFGPVDQAFLDTLEDYKIGMPAASPYKAAEAIRADGYVGVYTTAETLRRPAVRAKTGWHNPERVLGREFKEE